MSSILLSLAKECSDDSQMLVVDLSKAGNIWSDKCTTIAQSLPLRTKVGIMRDFPTFVEEARTELSGRVAEPSAKHANLFLVIVGIQRARQLRETLDKWGAPGEINQKFSEICREGPELGIHVIAWCDTLGNFISALERRMLDEFDNRVALQMSTEDFTLFIESTKASSLGQSRALFFDVSSPGNLEKFRPYELPSDEEITSLCSTIRETKKVVNGGDGRERQS